MKVRTIGGLRTRVLGGTDGDGAGDGPLVVLLHGFGASGGDLVPLADVIAAPPGTRFAFPEAPIELPWGWDARAWWMIDMERLERALATGEHRDLTDDVPEGLAPARASLDAFLAEAGTPMSRVVLGGFSQGGMLACDVALRRDERPAGLVLMSSTLLAAGEWLPRVATTAGLRVLQSHGTADPLLPFTVAERLRDAFVAAGADVTWVPFRGAHEVPHPVLAALSRFVSETLG